MVEEIHLQDHLRSISKESWSDLFSLIPEIEQTNTFSQVKGGEEIREGVIRAPYISEAEVVSKFFAQWHRMDLMVVFNWPKWQEGKEAGRDPDFDYNSVPASFLCKLISAVIRNDRFCEGALASAFADNTILKILVALQQKVEAGDLN